MRDLEIQKLEYRRNIRQQHEEYEKIISEKYKPKVSEKKRAELEKQITSLKTSPRTRLSPIISKMSDSEDEKPAKKRILWAENPLKPKPKAKREFKVINYLRENRNQH